MPNKLKGRFMKSISLYKASPITKKKPVESAQITIEIEMPQVGSLKQAEQIYKRQAKGLLEVLSGALPQGTRHQLLIVLLQDSSNLYKGI